MIQIIHEHSIDVSLLTGGWVIDAGCRNWHFAKHLKSLGEKVYCLDIDALEKPQEVDCFLQKPLLNENKTMYVNIMRDLNASFIDIRPSSKSIKTFTLESITLNEIYTQIGTDIDLLKLDIEGSEYDILMDDGFQPIPKQLSIEFHEHCFPEKHNKYFNKCLEKIKSHYDPVKLDRVPMHGCGPNYWDCLFIKKNNI